MAFFASRQFLFFRYDTSPRSFQIQNKMIGTPGAKIRENFGKSNRPGWGGGARRGPRGKEKGGRTSFNLPDIDFLYRRTNGC